MELTYKQIDALRLKAFKTNNPEDRQKFLEAAGKWFQHEPYREMERERVATLKVIKC